MYKIKDQVSSIYDNLHKIKIYTTSEDDIQKYINENGEAEAAKKYGVILSPKYISNFAWHNIDRLFKEIEINYFDRINSLIHSWYIFDNFIMEFLKLTYNNQWISKGRNAKILKEVRKVWTHPLDVHKLSEKVPSGIAHISYSHGSGHGRDEVIFTPISFHGENFGHGSNGTITNIPFIICEYFKEINIELAEIAQELSIIEKS